MGKNAKKFRNNCEYCSARWGTAKDIEPYVDPAFANNIILTQTERLTMNSRPKDPRTARNKNVLVVGGSGSGKTRFFVKPNLMQCVSEKYPCSFVVTDPKGSLIVESGRMLRRTERFSTEEQLIVADIDTEKLLNSRRRTTTFAPHRPAERIIVEIPLPENPANVTLDREFNSHPFVPQTPEEMDESGREIINIQTMGLAQRLQHTDCKKVVIGVSGGLDSTLALLSAVRTFDRLGLDRKGIIGVTMPGFGTSNRTYRNSIALMRCLGITSREISIRKACEQHFADIGLNPEEQSSAYENAQARERTQILMDIANMEHGMVLGTGDLSELALGWATYNGDQMSMYGLNASLPKTLIQVLLRWMAQVCQDDAIREILLDVVATPISPELLPSGEEGGIAQHTEKLVGPYELHDFFLYHFIQNGYSPAKILFAAETAFDGRYDRATILRWMRVFFQRFFSQQFKRSAMPDGPKVGIISLSPRGDWRMPSDATATLWLREIDLLIQEK